MNKKTVKDIDLKGKKVFVRCDFNVPMDENQNITDNTRIVAALPTIKYLLEQNCKIILENPKSASTDKAATLMKVYQYPCSIALKK